MISVEAGSYQVVASASGFSSSSPVGVSVTAGGSVTADLTMAPLPPPSGFVVRINAGSSSSFTDSAGQVWGADQYFVGGKTYSASSVNISGTADDGLYRSQRYSMSGYAVPVPAAGTYRVTLRIAEIYFTASGQRVFGVDAEGSPVLRDLDAVAAVGANAAFDQSFDVTVSDGVLSLGFVTQVQNPQIQGLSVVRLS